ncbi:MAG TPA: CBS domain-containing protein [Pseudoalteromonas sp.]|uniref:CBS domain-containing protein n=1 Tax=marine sediment metagenome TaxID=412755 RepID=A0A0F9Q132_9ZZZZ|nr:nucleotidyltransferase family protein [Pseudoalteromonas sp.]HDZ33956.1 CBS domain-containing protein [Pseudoalteromonas sp.]
MSHQWENILINPSFTIREALEVIDGGALRGAIVVDQENRLLGVVSDGDIRRGILSGISLDSPVANVMNKNPIVTSQATSRKKTIELMESKGILSVPLVEDGVVIGLHTLYDSLSIQKLDNPVFLMAGGFGTRLRPLTNNCPKPLLKVGDKPILEITILNFIKSGFVNFYISTHFMPEMIMEYFGDGSKWGVNITYVHEEEPLGTGGALGLLPKDLPKLPLIMMNGDILTNIDFQKLLSFHCNHIADASMCVREYEYQIPYGVIQGKDGKIISMEEKPTQLFHINAGIYVVNPELIEQVKANEIIDMPTLLEQKIKAQGNVMMFPIHEYWLDIGRMDDYKRAQADIHTLGL